MYSPKRRFRLFRHPAWAPPAPPLELTLTRSGGADTFILKYNSLGTAQWVRKIGGLNNDLPNGGICIDAIGNFYVAGVYLSNPVTIFDTDNETPFVDLAISGTADVYIVKYNASGVPQWVRKIGGGSVNSPVTISVDPNGNVYTTGTFDSNPITVFNTDNSTAFTTIATTGQDDVFIVKHDTSGTPLWARKVGGTLAESAGGLSVDSSGNVYISGSYASATFRVFNTDNTTNFATLANSGTATNDVFVVKYNTSGTPQWVRKIAGTSSDTAAGVSVDSSGNVYVGGSYSSSPVTIFNTDNTTSFTTLSRTGTQRNVFLVKYDTSGTPLWARKIAGSSSQSATDVFADSIGNVCITGSYGSNPLTIFNSDNTTSFVNLTNSGTTNVFLAKYNTSGTPQWARKIGGSSSDDSRRLFVDSSGNVHIVGQYNSDTLTIFNTDNTTSFVDLTNLGAPDGYVVKYNTSGTPQWARGINGFGSESVSGVSVDGSGNVLVVGNYTSNPLTIPI
jgi:hypothetical protein